jgi:hypothetical protein
MPKAPCIKYTVKIAKISGEINDGEDFVDETDATTSES